MIIKSYVKRIALVSMFLVLVYVAMAAALTVTDFSPVSPVPNKVGETRSFTITVDQPANFTWYLNGTPVQSNENVASSMYTIKATDQGTSTINATATNANSTVSNEWTWIVTALLPGAPNVIESPSSSTPVVDTVGMPKTFSITADQTVNVTWYINETQVQFNESVIAASYTNTSASQGTIIIKATATNDNGTVSKEWTWIVTAPAPGITGFAPETPVNDTEGANRSFNINVNQTVDVVWYINGTVVQDTNKSVTEASYTNTSAVPGIWNVTATATNDNGTVSKEWTWNVKDITPPANVTNLIATDRGQTYINWTWENPQDIDFNMTRILIDDSFRTSLPKTSSNYNATELAPGAPHKITVIAFDASDNNATPTENTSTTLPNTLPGDRIPMGLPSGVIVSFNNVTNEGNTTVSFTQISQVTPPFSPLGNYVDINTSASFTGKITITLNYPQPAAGFNESGVRLYHLNNSVWEDITTNLDTTTNSVTGEVTSLSLFAAGIYPPPKINVIQAPSLNITVRDSLVLDISVDQTANVTWMIDGSISEGPSLIQEGESFNFTFAPTAKGTYSIAVEAINDNGTDSRTWNVTVHPKFFFKGNRIWDGSRPDEFSLTYTWDPMSFSGFYYDIEDDVGNENIAVTLDSYSDRTINKGDLVYTTTPQEVSFGYSGFGSYEVIGFMAEKYFAGYTANSKPPGATTTVEPKSVIAQGQLHRVLIDDDTKRTISVGSTLTLQDGYVLKAKDIDLNARTMLISLLKDGDEVDPGTPLSAGQTYVYTKKVGAVSDLPLILVRFDSVFSGREVQAAFLQGMFQISESADTVSAGNDFGDMEVESVSSDKIEMSNRVAISLSEGSTEDLMGDVKIIVADNSSAVRFALSVEKTGSFEVRSSIYKEDDPVEEWTPYNFGMNIGKTSIGFYYDLDDGIGNENLALAEPLDGSRTIDDGNLLYTTKPQEVSFGYSGFGSYEVIGFMAEKYFAGYTANSNPLGATTSIETKSALAQGQLHKVLIDDDIKRTISVGSTLTLQDGYVLKAKDIDLNARTMLISLLKDGVEVDEGTPLSAGETYVYTKKAGAVSDLPLILVRFDSVFSGREVQAAFLQGMFQISENYATVTSGNKFGIMEVRSVGEDRIEMSNDGSISLDRGENEVLMGNIKLKVGDTTDNSLRFYFGVDVTPGMVANQLVIDAPARANAGDDIKIKVTAGGGTVDNASLAINSSEIGKTDMNGTLNYTLPRTMKGVYNITATKLGYLKATKNIEVLEYIERRLSIDAPAKANQFETIVIKVTSNGTAVSGVTMRYDNTTINSTDSNGTVNYTLETSGVHTISASKSGYITASRDIEVRAPFSEYKALDINITPNVVFTNEEAVITSNITNVGTKKDTLPVELIINGTVVDNSSVTLAPGEIKEINFTRKEAEAGNYTVEILGQKGLLEVRQKPLNWFLILAVATVLGAVVIYLWTAKDKTNIELIRRKLKFS